MEYRSPWERKEEMKRKAQEHYNCCAKKYAEEIEKCVEDSIIYDATGKDGKIPEKVSITNSKENIKLEDLDTVKGSIKLETYLDLSNSDKDKIAPVTLLNFASYKNPGGGFLNGSMAQEEALCHESILYNVLEKFQILYYDINLKDKNRALYRDKAIFTPNVVFEKNGCQYKFNVLTCAAPNFRSASKYEMSNKEENTEILEKRIEFMDAILKENEAKNIVLGAWGCGVFGQNPREIAELFLDKMTGYNNVVYAIPKSKHNNNFEEFEKVIRNYLKQEKQIER